MLYTVYVYVTAVNFFMKTFGTEKTLLFYIFSRFNSDCML